MFQGLMMRRSRRRVGGLLLMSAMLLSVAAPAAWAEKASHTDVARFLAGMQPSENSPLAVLAKSKGWQNHARTMNQAWKSIDKRQLSKIRPWSAKHLPNPSKTLFYMFSGPDYLYANAFFPKATTIVMAGLELVGSEPDVTKLSLGRRNARLGHLRSSLNTILRMSYFITSDMARKLSGRGFKGTLPVIYVFLARAGKTIEAVSHHKVNNDGTLTTLQGDDIKKARAVKITFSEGAGREKRVVYYFRTDLSDKAIAAKGGFLNFLGRLGEGDALVKSASYLLHYSSFTRIRNFLMAKARTIVQDDTGIKLSYFKTADWNFTTYGRYVRPIPVFSGRYQTAMARLFRKNKPKPIKFGVGYRWRQGTSNLLVVTKKAQLTVEDSAKVKADAPGKPASSATPAEPPKPVVGE